jgi:DNA helicase-2/ATP-dependent DNA helicase PcrA
MWESRGKASLLQFPINLEIAPPGNNHDDHARLLYVAMTRAKSELYLTSYALTNNNKEILQTSFLQQKNEKNYFAQVSKEILEQDYGFLKNINNTEYLLETSLEIHKQRAFAIDEQSFLKKRLEEYMMSVTHLNNFLDITRGGPQTFLEQNILQFPQAKTPESAYGTAVHTALERMYTHIRHEKKIPNIKKIEEWFIQALTYERMSDRDYSFFEKKGISALHNYFETKENELKNAKNLEFQTELNFSNQSVILTSNNNETQIQAHVTGKIDKVVFKNSSEIIVADFKTGKALEKWDKLASHEAIKMYRYRNQLMFYKLLIENSRDFSRYTVQTGMLEFIEPIKNKHVDLLLDITQEETDRLKKLVCKVYEKVMNLDFPDISNYTQDLAGIKEFEEDLLKS